MQDERRYRVARRFLVWGCLLVCCGLVQTEEPAKFNRVLKLGASAPAWEGFPETRGGELGLSDFGDERVVVLFFTRNHCPMSKKYSVRIRDLSRSFEDRGVKFVGVNVSRKMGENLEEMRKRREELGWKFPYLKDPDGKLAGVYGATVTPQFFVLNEERRVVYMGGLDDHPDVKKVQEEYLRWAIELVLSGKEVEIPESLAVGCEIESGG